MKDFLKQPLAVRCGVGDAETKVEMTALDAQSVQFAVQEPEGEVVSMQLAGTMETLGAALERGAEIKVKLPGCVFAVSFDLEADKTVIPYMVRPIEPEIDIPDRFEGTWVEKAVLLQAGISPVMGLVLLVFLTLMALFFIIWLIGKVIKSRIPKRPIPARPSPGGPAPGGRSTMAELGWESFEIVVEDRAYSIAMKEGG